MSCTIARPAREPDRELASPIRTQPENATAQPANSHRGNPSFQEDPGEDGDQYRAGVDQHRGGPRVDATSVAVNGVIDGVSVTFRSSGSAAGASPPGRRRS